MFKLFKLFWRGFRDPYVVDEAWDVAGLFGVRRTSERLIQIVGSREEAEREAARLNAKEHES